MPDRDTTSNAVSNAVSTLTAHDDIVRALRTDGYAVVPGLLPADDVAEVRDDIANVYQNHGWLAADKPAAELVPDQRRRDGVPGWWRFAEDVQRLERFHRLAHDSALTSLATAIVGAPVLHHSRRHLTIVNPSFWAGRPSSRSKGYPQDWSPASQGSAICCPASSPRLLPGYHPAHGACARIDWYVSRGAVDRFR